MGQEFAAYYGLISNSGSYPRYDFLPHPSNQYVSYFLTYSNAVSCGLAFSRSAQIVQSHLISEYPLKYYTLIKTFFFYKMDEQFLCRLTTMHF